MKTIKLENPSSDIINVIEIHKRHNPDCNTNPKAVREILLRYPQLCKKVLRLEIDIAGLNAKLDAVTKREKTWSHKVDNLFKAESDLKTYIKDSSS